MAVANPASILDSVKKVLGLDPDYEAFDLDVIMFLNASFGTLIQLGVGPVSGFTISDNSTLWAQYITRTDMLGMVKTLMFMQVKLMFDPPATSFAIDAIKSQIAELTWRITVMAEDPQAMDPDDNVTNVTWWNLTGLSDFPDGAITGDCGVDLDTDNMYAETSAPSSAYWWDLTGLSDFPAEAVNGEWGIDMSTGDVWECTTT